jgi:hypothetical protein
MGATHQTDDASNPPWFPSSLVDRVCEPGTFAEGLPSPWGRIHGWDYSEALVPQWWRQDGKGRWGHWPTEVEEVKVVSHTRSAVVIQLDAAYTAHLYPFQTGRDVSNLALFAPWADSLASTPLVMPVAGMHLEHGDAVVVFPVHTCAELGDVGTEPMVLASSLAQVHAALVEHQTPNTERRWNDRLKSMEDGLKSTTLWRASHTKHVVGLPPLHITLAGVVRTSEGVKLVPQPRSLVDHLLASAERLPGVANAALLEQRLALQGAFAHPDDRQAFYRAWGAHLPSVWTSASTVSTVNGGVWIWRYEAMLLLLGEARAFGLSTQASQCERWLLDVSRIQARLGELRTVHAVRNGGLYAALATAVIGSGPMQLPVLSVCLMAALVAHVLNQKRVPPPY